MVSNYGVNRISLYLLSVEYSSNYFWGLVVHDTYYHCTITIVTIVYLIIIIIIVLCCVCHRCVVVALAVLTIALLLVPLDSLG